MNQKDSISCISDLFALTKKSNWQRHASTINRPLRGASEAVPPILAHLHLQKILNKKERDSSSDTSVFQVPSCKAPEQNLRKLRAHRRSNRILLSEPSHRFHPYTGQSEHPPSYMDAFPYRNSLKAVENTYLQTHIPMHQKSAEQLTGTQYLKDNESRSTYKTVDIKQAELNISNRQRVNTETSELDLQTESKRRKNLLFYHADRAKAQTKLQNAYNRKQCDSYFMNPIFDSKEYIFRRHQRKAQHLLQKATNKRFILPPMAPVNPANLASLESFEALQPKYSRENSESFSQYPSIEIFNQPGRSSAQESIQTQLLRRQIISHRNPNSISQETLPKECVQVSRVTIDRNSEEPQGISFRVSSRENGNSNLTNASVIPMASGSTPEQFTQTFKLHEKSPDRTSRERTRQLKEKLKAFVPVAHTSRTATINHPESLQKLRLTGQSVFEQSNAAQSQKNRMHQTTSSEGMALMAVPPLHVSISAVRTVAEPDTGRQKFAKKLKRSLSPRKIDKLEIGRTGSWNAAYELQQDLRLAKKVAKQTELSKFVEESLSGQRITLVNNPKQQDTDSGSKDSSKRDENAIKTGAFGISHNTKRKKGTLRIGGNRGLENQRVETEEIKSTEVFLIEKESLRLSGNHNSSIFRDESPLAHDLSRREKALDQILGEKATQADRVSNRYMSIHSKSSKSSKVTTQNVKSFQVQETQINMASNLIEEEFVTQSNALIEMISHQEQLSELIQSHSVNFEDRMTPVMASIEVGKGHSSRLQSTFDIQDPYQVNHQKSTPLLPVKQAPASIRSQSQSIINKDIKPIVDQQTPRSNKKITLKPQIIDINLGAFPTVGPPPNIEQRNTFVKFVRESTEQTTSSKMPTELDNPRLDQMFQLLQPPQTIVPSTLALNSGEREQMPMSAQSFGLFNNSKTNINVRAEVIDKSNSPFKDRRVAKVNLSPSQIKKETPQTNALPAREPNRQSGDKPFKRYATPIGAPKVPKLNLIGFKLESARKFTKSFKGGMIKQASRVKERSQAEHLQTETSKEIDSARKRSTSQLNISACQESGFARFSFHNSVNLTFNDPNLLKQSEEIYTENKLSKDLTHTDKNTDTHPDERLEPKIDVQVFIKGNQVDASTQKGQAEAKRKPISVAKPNFKNKFQFGQVIRGALSVHSLIHEPSSHTRFKYQDIESSPNEWTRQASQNRKNRDLNSHKKKPESYASSVVSKSTEPRLKAVLQLQSNQSVTPELISDERSLTDMKIQQLDVIQSKEHSQEDTNSKIETVRDTVLRATSRKETGRDSDSESRNPKVLLTLSSGRISPTSKFALRVNERKQKLGNLSVERIQVTSTHLVNSLASLTSESKQVLQQSHMSKSSSEQIMDPESFLVKYLQQIQLEQVESAGPEMPKRNSVTEGAVQALRNKHTERMKSILKVRQKVKHQIKQKQF